MIKQRNLLGGLSLSALLATFSSATSYAAPFNSFDAKSMAMGGAGVAVASPATAPFFNPALLSAAREDDNFTMELPIVGVRAYDPDEFAESLDDFQDNSAILDANDDFVVESRIDNVNAYIQAMNWAAAATELQLVADDTRALSSGLVTLSDKAIGVELGAGMVVGIPNESLGIAFSISGWGAGGGIANYRDATTLETLADDMDTYAGCVNNPGGCTVGELASLTYVDPLTGEVTFDVDNDIKSTVDIRAIALTELSVSLAREFTLAGKEISVGITPKYRKVRVFDYTADVNNADDDDFDADDYIEEHDDFNIDLGVAKDYENGWRAGFVVKNMIPAEFESKQGNDVELTPQARIGVSHQNDFLTAAFDLDLTTNDPVSFEHKTQFAAVGVELNALDWMQVRAGYRANLAASTGNIASVGLGLSPLGVHLDLAVAASEDEVGASMQFGFRF